MLQVAPAARVGSPSSAPPTPITYEGGCMSLPYLRLYPQDYLQDTNHLTTEEHGAYLLLIINYWQTEKPLIDDDKRLAGICRADARQWSSIRLAIADFFIIENGFWTHKRIEVELKRIARKSEAAKRAGKLGGLTRHSKQQLTSERLADSSERLATQTQTHTQTHKNNINPCIKSDDLTPPLANGEDFERFWKHWPLKRNKKKAKDVFMRKKFEVSDITELIADVESRKKKDKQWRGGFIPHCTT